MRRTALGVILLGVSAGIMKAAIARADAGDDAVVLVDGSTLKGRITQQAPGSFVVIQMNDGHVESIPWSQVKRVSASAAPLPSPSASPVVVPPPAPGAAATPVAAAPAPAAQSAPADVHFELGARLGYSVAAGDYFSGTQLTSASDSDGLPGISGGAAMTLDLGVRISAHIYVGAFFSYSLLSTSCMTAPSGSTLTCEAHDMRGGIDAQFHLRPRATVDPWAGFGLGHEWLNINEGGSAPGVSASQSINFEGWNFAHFMLGVDFHIGNAVGLGPYLELTSGSYGSASASTVSNGSTAAQSQSLDLSSTSSHQWVTLGMRGTYEAL